MQSTKKPDYSKMLNIDPKNFARGFRNSSQQKNSGFASRANRAPVRMMNTSLRSKGK